MKTDLTTRDFTFREHQIITLIHQGNSSREIAELLNLSSFTIKKHRDNIARKMGSAGKTEFRKTIFQLIYAPNIHSVQNNRT